MSMERELHAAVPQTPDFCREAVLQATGTYREERHMRKSYKLVLAAAMMLALLCGTAYAVVNYYSVRDYVGKGQTSAAFEQNIVPLGQSAESHGVAVTLGDAIFDGKHLFMTMSITAPENAEPLLIVPELTAWRGEKQLDAEINAFSQLYISSGREYSYNQHQAGIFVPAVKLPFDAVPNSDRMAVEALLPDAQEGEITWRYTVHIFKPLGEFVKVFPQSPGARGYELWMDSLRLLHSQGKITMSSGVGDMLNYVTANGDPENKPYHACYEEDPLFEKLDAMSFEFTALAPKGRLLVTNQLFLSQDADVRVRWMTQSFMQVDFMLDVSCSSDQLGRIGQLQPLQVFDQNGNELHVQEQPRQYTEDVKQFSIVGSVTRISDEPLTALTFRFYPDFLPEWGSLPEFTVQLEQ